MSVAEVARILGVKESTVYLLCERKKIEHYRYGCGRGRIDITTEGLERYRAKCFVPVEEVEQVVVTPLRKAQRDTTDWVAEALKLCRRHG